MKRALIVGINDYSRKPLNGCIKDANRVGELIARNEDGTPNFDTKIITCKSETVSRGVLMQSLNALFKDEAEMALLYFSGHGSSGQLGGQIITQDMDAISMRDILDLANQSKVKECIIMLDCCFSGDIGATNSLDNGALHIREGITILTASRKTQVSMENRDGGLFTSLVCDALRGGAADLLGLVSTSSVFAHVEPIFSAWEQRPMFKTHVSRSTPLRRCKPLVDPSILRELPSLFKDVDTKLNLDKTYEPDERPKGHKNEEVFKKLQQCRANGLVKPDGEDHMYYAAIRNKSCSLTALGQFYWHLAKANRI